MINSLRVIRAMINKEKTDILRNKKNAYYYVYFSCNLFIHYFCRHTRI